MGAKWRARSFRAVPVVIVAIGVLGTTLPTFAATGDSAGCPTAENFAPAVNGFIEINTPGKLQMLRDSSTSSAAMSAKYRLTSNIDLSGCTWAGGISSATAMFSGEFDGNSKTISNVTVIPSSAARPDQGFFRYLSGRVYDLTMSSLTVTASATTTNPAAPRIGGLAASLREGGSVSNVTLSSINIAGGEYVGGAFGETLNNTTIDNMSLSGSVTGVSWVGGLVGDSQSTITGITSSVNVTVDTSYAGGLVANLRTGKSITDSSVTGNVTATSNMAGGVVGQAGGNRGQACSVIRGVRSSGQVTAVNNAAGIAATATCLTLDRSSSSSVITATAARAGGLIGGSTTSEGTITKSFFTGQVQGASSVGGLVGYAMSPITDSYSTGSVTATSTTGKVGGLVGEVFDSTVVLTRVYATGAVTGPASVAAIGGLIGGDSTSRAVVTSGLWDKGSTGQATSANTSAKGFTTQQLRDFVLYDSDNLNWSITDGISSGDGITTGTTWSICSGLNSGYPFLTRQSLSGTCLPTMAYNENTASAGSAPLDPTTPYTSGSTVTVLGNTGSLARTGFVFNGWNTKANGTGTNYAAGDTFTITSPVMLFARWTSAPTITYSNNSGTGSISQTTALAGSSVTLSSGSSFTRSGFTLARWDTRSDGLGTSYALGATITMPSSNTTLHAIWVATRWITYNSNGGSGSISGLSAGAGLSATLSGGSNFTRSGFTLARWDTRSDGLGTSYALGATITMPSTNTTLYAVWSADSATTTTTTSTTTTTTVPSTTTTIAAPAPATTSPPSQSAANVTTTTAVRTSSTIGAPMALTPTSTPLSLATTTTVPPKEQAPDVPRVNPGGTGATVGGRPVDATVTHDDGDLVIAVDDATIRYSLTTSSGERKPIPISGVVDLEPGSEVSVRLSGLASTAKTGVWVLPSGLLLGEVKLENGSGSVTGVVPEDVSVGESRLVVKSETADGEPLVVAYGVQVTEPDSAGRSWSFALLIIVGLAVVSALFIPAARRRRDDEEETA